MKKQMQVIVLIVITVVILAGARQLDKESAEKAETIRMTACSKLLRGVTVKSWSISEETDEDSFDVMLKWFQDWYQGASQQNAVHYQMIVPCHFFVTQFFGKDPLNTYEYRNIDENDEALWKGGIRINEAPAYVADMIIDTYIREYGGEDTQYYIEIGMINWIEPELGLDYSMKIYNDNVTLNVIWYDYIAGVICVYIEDCDGAEVQDKRMIECAYHMDAEGYYDYARRTWDDAYCMFIDPEPKQKEYHYRNVQSMDIVSREDALICDAFGYAIADQAIDKYIRDWGGSDILYDVKLIYKIKDEENGTYHYTLSVMDKDEEVLQVEYTDKEWFVMVNICN